MAMVQAARREMFPEHPYAWVITRDRYAELSPGQPCDIGVTGPSQATEEMIEWARTRGRPFRMRDEGDIDDCADAGTILDPAERGVVYEGLIWTRDEPGTEIDFGPLRDFGDPNFGCTEIQYRVDGRWVLL